MAIVMVPVMAAFERDLQTNLRLLEEIVLAKGHEAGFEVIGKPEHFLEQEGRERMVDNLKKHAQGMKIASHQWSGNIIYDSSPDNRAWSDLRTGRGAKVLRYGVEFAKEAIKAGLVSEDEEIYVHAHGGELYFGERMSKEKLEKDRELIKQNLLKVSREHLRIKIGLENLPVFPNSDNPDLINCPEKVGKTVFETLEDYVAVVNGTNLMLTFDAAHFAYDLEKGRIDLVSAVDVFGGYLRHVHVSDAKGVWVPHESVAGDGYVPGEGKIGSDEFARFFRHLKDNYDLSKINVEAEVQDSDYSNLVNREETLRRIVKWLD